MRGWRELLRERESRDALPMRGQVFAARLSEQFAEKAPGLPRGPEGAEGARSGGEPEESLDAQREGAPERP